MKCFPLILATFYVFLASPSSAQSVSPKAVSPKVCIAYYPDSDSWGPRGIDNDKNFDSALNCPPNYAYYSSLGDIGKKRAGKFIRVLGSCCPLPSTDILKSEHVFEPESCPENSVATGVKPQRPVSEEVLNEIESKGESSIDYWRFTEKHLRCTKINTERYQLSKAQPARRWGWSKHFSTMSESWVTRQRIPLAIRHSIGRLSRKRWRDSGCVGYPWGSLLTKKESKYCNGAYYRQLQYRGLAGDPVRGTPVVMFPDCSVVDHPMSTTPQCVN